MVSRKPFYLLVALLFIVGLGMTFYHHVALDVPLTPGEKRQIWSIEAKLEFEATGEPVINAVRTKEAVFTELQLDAPGVTDAQLIDAMLQHPILINRPIVVTPLGTRLCRPSEQVLDILPAPQQGAFTKEDGEVVINAQGQRA